jgi:hypothetical protein
MGYAGLPPPIREVGLTWLHDKTAKVYAVEWLQNPDCSVRIGEVGTSPGSDPPLTPE